MEFQRLRWYAFFDFNGRVAGNEQFVKVGRDVVLGNDGHIGEPRKKGSLLLLVES
jgi:hypothetical protein